jgi:hypothetical protein
VAVQDSQGLRGQGRVQAINMRRNPVLVNYFIRR